jgi:hypothetical protein
VGVQLQHPVGFKSFRKPLMYLERWGSYTGADENSNVLEYYAVSTGKYLATSSSPRKAVLGLLDPKEVGTRLLRNVGICQSTRRFSDG